MIDYILTAAVGISAGVTAMTSALPKFQPHTLALCLVILAILAVVNLRGVKDTGTAFVVPTFLFIGTLLTLLPWHSRLLPPAATRFLWNHCRNLCRKRCSF